MSDKARGMGAGFMLGSFFGAGILSGATGHAYGWTVALVFGVWAISCACFTHWIDTLMKVLTGKNEPHAIPEDEDDPDRVVVQCPECRAVSLCPTPNGWYCAMCAVELHLRESGTQDRCTVKVGPAIIASIHHAGEDLTPPTYWECGECGSDNIVADGKGGYRCSDCTYTVPGKDIITPQGNNGGEDAHQPHHGHVGEHSH